MSGYSMIRFTRELTPAEQDAAFELARKYGVDLYLAGKDGPTTWAVGGSFIRLWRFLGPFRDLAPLTRWRGSGRYTG